MILWLVYLIAAYILGSIPFGYVIAKYYHGMDIQKVGSGNIGATNVYRNLGWKAGILTGVADVGKGFLPVLLARLSGVGGHWLAVVGLAAVLGHCYPLFLHFRGGKGVSTALAALLAMSPKAALLFVITWLLVLLFQGRVSVASLAAAASMPVLIKLFFTGYGGVFFFSWVAAIIIFIRHRENIDRLVAGKERALFNPRKFMDRD